MFMLDSCWCLTFCLAIVTRFGAFFHGFSSDVAGRLLKAHILVYTGQRRQKSSEEQIILAFGHNRGRQGLRMSRTWAHTQMSDPFGLQGQEVGGLFCFVPDSSAVLLFMDTFGPVNSVKTVFSLSLVYFIYLLTKSSSGHMHHRRILSFFFWESWTFPTHCHFQLCIVFNGFLWRKKLWGNYS